MASPAEIAQVLSSTLSPDTNVRINAELSLSEHLANPQSALALTQLVTAQDADNSLRQIRVLRVFAHSASIVLRKYVKERWSPYFSQFKGNAPPVEVKDQIRRAVFQSLSDPDRKIRSLSAHTLSTIANCDWPDEYPDLLTSLIRLLSSGSSDSIHGAMELFTEFIRADLTEDQILPVLRDLLPVLLGILGATEQHSPLTRSRTIAVFRQCVEALFMVKDQHPQAVKEASASVLPVWLDAFKVLLQLDPQQDVSGTNWDGLAVRIQVFRTLDAIHTSFPRVLAPYLPDYLTASLHHLQALYPSFSQYYLVASTPVPNSSEGEPIELTRLAAPLIDFVSAAARGIKARTWFDQSNLTALVDILVKWAQMTQDNEEEWVTDANLFVSQEDDETQEYSVRVAVFDLLSSLINNTAVTTVSAIQTTVRNVVSDSDKARQAGDAYWWRPLEGALAAVGSQNEAILDCIDDEVDSGRAQPIDIEFLLSDVIPSLITLQAYPFLQGRGLVFASRYSKLLPAGISGQYLDAAVQVIESSETGIPFKISAVKAIQQFCQGVEDPSLSAIVPRITRDLGPFLLQTTDDTLSLVLETLSVVVEVEDGKWLTVDLTNDLVAALLEVWTKNIKDPIFLSILTDLFSSIASSSTPGVYQAAVKQALPKLTEAIGSVASNQSWVASSAIELVSSLVQGVPESGPGEGFFATIASNLFNCLKVAEDRDVLQNGVSLLTLIVRKDVNQLLAWTDEKGQSGLANVLAVIARLLQSQDESGGLVIGDLIIHLLRRAGDSVLPVLPDLLQAMLSRMREAQTATFLQSLVIPFAFLIYNQRDVVLDLVENVTVDGRSGLDILLNTWCENAGTFQGFWPIRVSNLALCQLFMSERPILWNTMVKGDIIVKPETRNGAGEVIMTRSKTKAVPHEWTSVPFPVKALKLLLHDLQTNGEAATMAAPADVDSDDGDSEWADDEKLNQGLKEDEFAFISDMIGVRGMSFDNDDVLEGSDDEDLKNDPISQIDLRAHLVAFVQQCVSTNVNNFSEVVGQLNAEETLVVQRVVQEQT